jgi:DNA-binding transcriptional LysR family regulator
VEERLTAFLAVARSGRVSEAARRLHLAVSSVSHDIASLEADFGARLFVRTNRGMVLTPAGRTLLAYAEAIEAEWRRAFREVRRTTSGRTAVHLAASHTAVDVFLPAPLGHFRREHPDVRVTVTMANSATVLGQVESGQVDFGLVEGRLGARRLRVTALWQDELALAVSSRHPWAAREQVTLDELATADVILREEGSGTRRVLEAALHHAGRDLSDLRVVMELSSLRAIVAMVAHGVGVSVLSRRLALPDPAGTPAVAFVPVAGLRLRREIDLVARAGDELGDAARALVGHLEAAAAADRRRSRARP